MRPITRSAPVPGTTDTRLGGPRRGHADDRRARTGFRTSRRLSPRRRSPSIRPGIAPSALPARRSCVFHREGQTSARPSPSRPAARRSSRATPAHDVMLTLGDLPRRRGPGRDLPPLRRHPLRAERPRRARDRSSRCQALLGSRAGSVQRRHILTSVTWPNASRVGDHGVGLSRTRPRLSTITGAGPTRLTPQESLRAETGAEALERRVTGTAASNPRRVVRRTAMVGITAALS